MRMKESKCDPDVKKKEKKKVMSETSHIILNVFLVCTFICLSHICNNSLNF